jgi:hypothetical protein
VAAHFDRSLGLSVSSPVVLSFRDRGACCDITARIVASDGQTEHLAFRPLGLRQEKFLLGLAFSRPENWLAWHRSRPLDRPLRSGLEILALAVRGLTLVIGGLWLAISAPVSAQPKRPRRRAAVIGGFVVVLGLYPARLDAQQSNTFQETYRLSAITGSSEGVALHGPRAVEDALSMPVTKIIREATLEPSTNPVAP